MLALDDDRMVGGLVSDQQRASAACVCGWSWAWRGRADCGDWVQGLGLSIQERRLAALDGDGCVVVDRDGTSKAVCRRAGVSGMVVTLGEGVTELGGPCGYYVDVYRLGNGVYVVSGLGLGGQSDRGGLCVFGVGESGSVAVLGRASVGVSTDGLSVMVSRCRNRVCVAHKGGVSVVSVDSDGVVHEHGTHAVSGVSGDWYQVGLGWTLVVVELCSCTINSNRAELVVVDVGRGGDGGRVVGVVKKHEPSGGYERRACCAGEHLVVPGYVGKWNGPVDIVRMGGDELSSWSHVRRYTIPDLNTHSGGHPCVVGGKLVLVYMAKSPNHLKMRIGS